MSEPATRAVKHKSEKTLVFRTLAYLLLPFMYFVARYRLQGTENVPTEGAFVLAPNHYSEIDPIVVGLAMWRVGRMPRYLAKASLFRVPVLGWLLKASGQIPVERSGSRTDPILAAKHVADNGLALVIYPEGTLTRDPDLWPMRGKTGVVRTALATGIPVIPVAQWGAQLILPRYGKRISFFPRKTVDILFGPPVDLSAFRHRGTDGATLAEATTVVMNAITKLVEQLRDETAPVDRWDPAKHNQEETGRFEQ